MESEIAEHLGGSLPQRPSFAGAHSRGLCRGGQGLARTAGGDQELVEQQLAPWSNSGGFPLEVQVGGFLFFTLWIHGEKGVRSSHPLQELNLLMILLIAFFRTC